MHRGRSMSFIEILKLFGVPTLLFGAIVTFVTTKFKKYNAEQNALKKGVQAMLRSQMIDMYNQYKDVKKVPIYVKDNFENVWNAYHNLGANGVMDNIHEEFMNFETE